MEKETYKSKEIEEFLMVDTHYAAIEKVNQRCRDDKSMKYLEDLLDKATDENMLRIVNEQIVTPKEKAKEYQSAYYQMSCDLRFLKTVVEGEYVNTIRDVTGSIKAYYDYCEKIKNYLNRLADTHRKQTLVEEIVATAEKKQEEKEQNIVNALEKEGYTLTGESNYEKIDSGYQQLLEEYRNKNTDIAKVEDFMIRKLGYEWGSLLYDEINKHEERLRK